MLKPLTLLLLPTPILAASFTYNLTYDGANRVTHVKVDEQNTAKYEYRANGQLVRVTLTGQSEPPGKPILVSPTGTITNNQSTYTWQATSTATDYQLWVNDATGNVINTWYTASVCAMDTCTVTPAITLAEGDATWWIRAKNSVGEGPWSDGMKFTLLGLKPIH